MTRFQPNVVYPGGGGPRLHVPYSNNVQRSPRGPAAPIYAYPVYVGGGFYDPSAYGYADASGAPPQQQPGNVTVIYPPASPTTATPVIINIGTPSGTAPQGAMTPGPPPPAAEPQSDVQSETEASEPTHYLIAFKDHTIYSAIAYWVDGSTLHYFTSGNVHNQVSLSLVDRDLTARLNRESGLTVNLPAR
jgi:hypothetical protein